MVYKWKDKAHFIGDSIRNLDPQPIGERIEALKTANGGPGGSIDAGDIVDDARQKASPLHEVFEWNDSTAAEEHRLWQARMLIGSVVACSVEITDANGEEKEFHPWVSVRSGRKSSYMSTSFVMSDSELREKFLRKAIGEFEQWEKRYKEYVELVTIFKEAAIVKARVLRQRIKPRKARKARKEQKQESGKQRRRAT